MQVTSSQTIQKLTNNSKVHPSFKCLRIIQKCTHTLKGHP